MLFKINLKEREIIELVRMISEWRSGEEIAGKFGISRNAVWKRINRLKEMGFEIESRKRLGYRIKSSPEFNPVIIAKILKDVDFLDTLYYYTETDSTNQRARNLEAGSFVIAKRQTSGRGRLGRKWFSDDGGLYFSIVLEPPLSIDNIPKLTLTSGVAVAEALEKYNARLKWPNDVLIDGKKVCGILSELTGELERLRVIVGIGINVENRIPDELESTATSLCEIERGVKRVDVLSEIIRRFSSNYKKLCSGKWDEIRGKWLEFADVLNKFVEVKAGGKIYRGVAKGIDYDGALLIESDGKIERVFSGDCFYI